MHPPLPPPSHPGLHGLGLVSQLPVVASTLDITSQTGLGQSRPLSAQCDSQTHAQSRTTSESAYVLARLHGHSTARTGRESREKANKDIIFSRLLCYPSDSADRQHAAKSWAAANVGGAWAPATDPWFASFRVPS